MNTPDTSAPLARRAGSAVHTCGEFWCLRPGKAPEICLIREVQDETPAGEPLPKLAIRFLNSGADFYFERWRELYAPDATFVPVPPPNAQRERLAGNEERINAERVAFERWIASRGQSTERLGDSYADRCVAEQWDAWVQATMGWMR